MGLRMEKMFSSASYAAGGGSAVLYFFTLNGWLAIGGFTLAVLTFIINWTFRYMHYKLEQRKAEAVEKKT